MYLVMATPTAKAVYSHLLTNILEFDANNIKELHDNGIKTYSRLKSQGYKNIDTLRKDNKYQWFYGIV